MKSRKLWFFCILSLLFTAMQVFNYLPADAVAYSNLMIGAMAVYAGGNVGDKFANRAGR